MRRKYILKTLLIALSYCSQGQFLHTPEEMESFIIDKPGKYILQETDDLSIDAFERCRNGANNHNVQSEKSTDFIFETALLSKSSRKKLKKQNKKITKQVSTNSDLDKIQALCANHYKLGNFEEALFYKLQTTKDIAFTFENEFFLAKSYYETKKYDFALEHVFNAKVLLPYSNIDFATPEIQMVETLLTEILNAKKLQYLDWSLNFSYCITTRENKTYISFKSAPWKNYAICKSVWAGEDNHKAKMTTISDQPSFLIEEKECLLNALVAIMRSEVEDANHVGLKNLGTAIDNNYINEYIYYEAFVSKYVDMPGFEPNKEMITKWRRYFLFQHSAKQ